jgi:hypothetical protein
MVGCQTDILAWFGDGLASFFKTQMEWSQSRKMTRSFVIDEKSSNKY